MDTKRNFRKVNMGMIESKGPSITDGKLNNVVVKEVIQTSSYKDRRNNYNYIENNINNNIYTENQMKEIIIIMKMKM